MERVEVDVDGFIVPFIGLEGLKANRRAVGRRQDLVDVMTLEALSGDERPRP